MATVLVAVTEDGHTLACKKVLSDALDKKKAACNDKLPELTALYQDKLPPVLTPDTLFRFSLVTGAKSFYGDFMKC